MLSCTLFAGRQALSGSAVRPLLQHFSLLSHLPAWMYNSKQEQQQLMLVSAGTLMCAATKNRVALKSIGLLAAFAGFLHRYQVLSDWRQTRAQVVNPNAL